VDQIIAHIENNILAREQAKEFYAKAVRGQLGTGMVDLQQGGSKTQIKCLTCKLDFVSPRHYNMAADSVVRSTYEPIFRGSTSPKWPYVVRGNSGLTLAWGGLTLGAFVDDFNAGWDNDIGVLLDETTSLWGSEILNGGHRKFQDVAFDFVIPAAASIGDLDNLADYVDSSTTSDIVLKVPRRHANDYLQITCKNALLVQNPVTPAPRGESGPRMMSAVWTGITDIEIIEKNYNAAGSSTPNVAADYNQA
jgi:hypothetical protein